MALGGIILFDRARIQRPKIMTVCRNGGTNGGEQGNSIFEGPKGTLAYPSRQTGKVEAALRELEAVARK